jgi:hypothetical protein
MSPRLEFVARHTAAELRRFARHENDRRAAMRMIAIAETMDGAARETAARAWRHVGSGPARCDQVLQCGRGRRPA